MTRSFSATNLVRLPHLSSSAAVALGDRLLAAADQQPGVPAALTAPRQRLTEAHGALREVRIHMDDAQASDPSAAGEADLWVDAAWAALHSFLKGWARLPARGGPGEAQGKRAQLLLDGLFSDGLRFLRLPFEQEWAETQKRLDRLEKPDFAEHLEALGADPFIDAVRRAFDAYSAALRKGESKPAGSSKLREPLARFVTALRSYVLNVTTYGDGGGEGSPEQALAEALLAPLSRWQASRGGRKGKAGPGDAGGDAGGGGAGGGDAGGGDAAGGDGGVGGAAGGDDAAGDDGDTSGGVRDAR